MREVTKENLIAQIDRLRKIKDEQGQLSMNGEYTLQAYEMLLATMEAEPMVVTDEMAITFHNSIPFGCEAEVGEIKEGLRAALANVITQQPAPMEAEPVALHMGEAINVFNALKSEQLSEHVNNAGLGPMGASNVQVWTSKAGGRLEFISANGGCTLNIFPQPAPVVPEEMTLEMMRAVQLNSELGAYAASNLSGAYDLFAEFWKVACRAAMLNQK